jgi:D-alanyl-lipoteichoic acid acyltransferase DltB (MBOAT superfamily)
MLFNSPIFLFVFLPIALVGFAILGRFGRRSAIGWLALASILFYAKWNPAFVLVLLGSMLGNFLLSRLIEASKSKPRMQSFWLIVAIVANLGTLGYFKYLFPLLNFFTHIGVTHHEWGSVVLPLGISFFTFTQLGYLIDLKQGEAGPQSLVSYALFVTFFPHLIAGPILHHKEIMPQFAEERRYGVNRDDFAVGLTWFIMGLFKKVMIADMLAPYANSVFDAPGHQTIATAWIGALNYMLELYFDFSGYSDMAIGLARMFSIRFPLNFNSPYKATSVIDFWSRWHMTLTRYITLYLYTPISLAVSRSRLAVGKKVSKKAALTFNGFIEMIAYPTIVTMFLAGIWHGAGTQFMVFGLIFGVTMTLEHAWNLIRASRKSSPAIYLRVLSVLRVNLVALIAFVFFRSSSTDDALILLRSMTGLNPNAHLSVQPLSLMVFLFLPVVWFLPNTQQILAESGSGIDLAAERRGLHWKPSPTWAVVMALAFFLSIIYMGAGSTFLYFQF